MYSLSSQKGSPGDGENLSKYVFQWKGNAKWLNALQKLMLTSITSKVNQNVFYFPRTFSSKKPLIRVYEAMRSPLATTADIVHHHGNIALPTGWRG